MRILALVLACVLLALGAGYADDSPAGSTCPAHRAAEAGFSPFDGFHEVMAPAWHKAWPDSNFAELFAAGPKFEKAFAAVAEMKPELKSTVRAESFDARRAELGRLVAAYAEAAKGKDRGEVYALMPALHDAFEQAAASLLPVNYPEFEGMVITLSLIIETHLPRGNMEGIIGSTETLLAKLKGLTPETLPEELREHKTAIQTKLSTMAETANEMQKCCENQDMDAYRQHIEALDGEVQQFIQEHI